MDLSRSDLATVGPVSGVDTLKVLPFGSKSRRQKLVVGDNAGFVTCLQSKRGETSAVFKTRVGESGNAVAALALPEKGDTIFAAQGRAVYGLNRKGKVLQKYDTKLSETVQNLVAGSDETFWASGSLTYTSFQRARELEYLNLGDAVTSLAVTTPDSAGVRTALVGGQGHQLRAVRQGAVCSTLATSGPPTSVARYSGDDTSEYFVYGTASGSLGVAQVDKDAAAGADEGTTRLRRVWEKLGDGGVNCIAPHDLSKDDVPDIIVGRDDGRVQVFRVQEEGAGLYGAETKHEAAAGMAPGAASLQFERFVDESVRSVQAGVVSTPGFDEVVLCTYSGNVISFSTEALDAAEVGDKLGRSKADVDVEGRTAQLKSDIKTVQKQIEAARAKLQKLQGPAAGGTPGAIGFEQLQIHHRFELVPRKGFHVLSLEMAVPMSLVVLHSDLPLRLLDAEEASAGDASRGAQSMVITKAEVPPSSSSSSSGPPGVRAVYRPEEPCKRVEIRIGTLEGQHGEIKVTVLAATSPQIGRQLTVDIKPLSLHQRCDVINRLDGVPLSSVQFTGSFSLHQVHDWIQSCLPGVPMTVPILEEKSSGNSSSSNNNNNNATAEDGDEEDPTAALYYRSALVDSVLIVRYRAGLVTIESDSVSAIAIAREVITAEANKRKANIVMRFEIKPETVPYFLTQLDAKLCKYSALAERALLADALREICSDADGSANGAFLATEHRSILAAPETSAAQQAQAQSMLQALHGVVTDLFVDVQKFTGREVRSPHVLSALTQVLENYSLEALLDFFQTGSSPSSQSVY